MPNTKDFVPITQVVKNTAILNDGSVVMVLQTSAVNFDLLSENEQLAIIGSFAAMLNSLSFSIQILIRSKKLDISHYLNTLKVAERKQTNPLLQLMMQHYRAFVAAIIRDNEVLDKQFFVVLAVSPIELGVVKSTDEKSLQKALTILEPRRDHILKQLSRIGLKSDQLDDERLIRLFYDIYNDEDKVSLSDIQGNPANQTAPNQGIGESVKGKVPAQTSPASPLREPEGSSEPRTALSLTPYPYSQPLPQTPLGTTVQAQAVNQITGYPKPDTLAQRPPIPMPQPQPTPRPNIPPAGTPPPQPPKPLYASPQAGNHSPFIVEELPG
jgi:hypothetical protein